MKISPQVAMTLRQIMLMNFGFFGIQYSFGLQQTAINPIFTMLEPEKSDLLPLLNMAGPVTGLLVQPIIGAMSDRTWVPGLGRRRPYFLIGAIGCSLCLFIYPHVTALWMAVLMLWLLDISNNTTMEPFRAFVADKLPEHQQSTGFLMQSAFTGLGITLANWSLGWFKSFEWMNQESSAGIPFWVFGSFYVGAFCSIASVLVTVLSTPEDPPSEAELAELRARPSGFGATVGEIFHAIKEMPTQLWQLALVYLFQWYALFIYWQYISHTIVHSVFDSTVTDKVAYGNAVDWSGRINGFYNIVTFIAAFGLMGLARKMAPKYVHALAVSLAAAALLTIPHINTPEMLYVPMIGFGIGWASMMAVPFLIVVKVIPKERTGVYMGVVNMMIVIPMLIQTVTFGPIYTRFLNSNPVSAMTFAGVFLAIAAVLTLTIKSSTQPPAAPH